MSVDTTVVILKCDDGFRVTTVQAVENITYAKDVYIVNLLFGKQPLLPTLDAAYEAALKEEEKHLRMMGYESEYGIRIVKWNGIPVEVEE